MKNRFIYSEGSKRYHTYDYYLNKKYGVKTAKIALNAGFSCPHIQNTGRGCIYCDSRFRLPSPQSLKEQFEEKKAELSKKWRGAKYIAYFQAGSNTFAPLAELKRVYESVLDIEGLAGIDIATRPDCVSREIAEYLGVLNFKTNVTVELGLQTCHEKTAEFINRGYKLEAFLATYRLLSECKIPAAIHIINGLPGENREMMIETAKYIASLDPPPAGVKIHMLYVEPGTELYDLYRAGKIKLLSKEEYIDIVVSQLEYLPPQIAIMRLTGDPDGAAAIPEWVEKKFTVINDIDKLMEKRGTYQGARSGFPATLPAPAAAPQPSESLTNILSAAKRLLDVAIKENGVYADFTMGKGNDTLYIKKMCPSGVIYAFDIQAEALEITKKRLINENCFDENVHLICSSHADFKKYVPENTELDGAIFNLGYLPGGDKSVTTKTGSTIACLTDALEILKPGGVIVVSVYPGHEEGTTEGETVLAFAESLDQKLFDCLYHRLVNIPEAPFIVAFQKKL